MYTIAVEKAEFDKFVQESSQEYNKDKIKCVWLRGKWIDCFKHGIIAHENEDFDLHGKIARVNYQVKHKDGNWLTATSMKKAL